ncbi:metal ABC transporter substrate-binding protein [Blastococcus brunescens]|uniref:Metal ABC transporter substrate-binding protein n=1 Tax=Blastococcus brunescens TaxID=1564165 RepID=A0ABZ1B7V3_9ACTN|nr:metal ABC transporter substrate-binding protein [Blastococcus sp. BMG 8361]WRL66892.1 metal ABC transporter substrate-binding protein [Blastococcus sp. BMG 8361]
MRRQHPGDRSRRLRLPGRALRSRSDRDQRAEPSQEPSAAQLAELATLVRERGVTTVYTETLVDPAVAETVADEAGVRTAVLDPIEGLTDESDGEDYLQVMRANLATLQEGQSCS